MLPAAIAALADEEGYWLPEPPSQGWSWASLREMVSFPELDELMVVAAAEAGSAALALSVHDEDSMYLSGGTADGVAFRMIFGADEFDAQELGATARELEYGGAEAFAAWATRYAPTPIEASVVRGYEDVFALLTGAGLFPEPGRQPAWRHWSPPGWASAGGWTW